MSEITRDIWKKFPGYTDNELNDLTAIAIQAMSESEELPDAIPDDVTHISNLAAARWLSTELQSDDIEVTPKEVKQILESPQVARNISLVFLDQARGVPSLSERISDTYYLRQTKMALPETLLLTGALVILAMKLKRVKWGSVQIEFEPFNEAMGTFLKTAMSQGPTDNDSDE